jgi:hypothetical protein
MDGRVKPGHDPVLVMPRTQSSQSADCVTLSAELGMRAFYKFPLFKLNRCGRKTANFSADESVKRYATFTPWPSLLGGT